MAESYLDLIRRLEEDPRFGPAMLADQGLALACYDLTRPTRRDAAGPDHAPRPPCVSRRMVAGGGPFRQPAAGEAATPTRAA